MRIIRKIIPSHIIFLFILFVLYSLIFSAFRFLLLNYNSQKLVFTSVPYLPEVFHIGYKFDSQVVTYFLLLPFVLLTISYFLKNNKATFSRFIGIYFAIITIPVLLICAADIPYFKTYHARITTSIHMWMDNKKEMLFFVFSEKSFYPFLFLFLAGSFFIIWIINILRKYFISNLTIEKNHPLIQKLVLLFICAWIIKKGLFGGNYFRPVGMRQAFFTNDAFINQLCLNPVYTYFDSYRLFNIDFIDDKKAMTIAQKQFGIGKPQYDSPIARKYVFNSMDSIKRNVVLVLMESMSAERMGVFGNGNLTPNLDSMAQNGLFFDNFYSCGIHTCNGVFGTLYSYPALMARHPMSDLISSTLDFTGIPVTLKDNGYQTAFFCTHDDYFDNIGYFLPKNGFQKLYSRMEYPEDKIENIWGVSDETLFDFAQQRIDSFAKDRNPFFATILTISTHPPYGLPKQTSFVPRTKDPYDQVYEYADWAIGNFMKTSAGKEWFKNTIFIFCADHGINTKKSDYEAPLSLNHSPLIIYSPGLIKKSEIRHEFSNQTDVYPTLMHLLGINFVCNTMGIDLLSEKRPYSYFSQDTKLGVINDQFYFMKGKFNNESMFSYRNNDNRDVLISKRNSADDMQSYAYSMLQVTQWMFKNKKTGVIK